MRTLLATTSDGIVRAARSGDGRWAASKVLTGYDVRSLGVDPLNASVVYAGTQGSGAFRSDDGGATWRPAGLDGLIVKALAVTLSDPGVVYAGTKPARLFVSNDGGGRWAELEAFRRIPGRWLWFSPAEAPFTAYVQAIALSPTDPRVILVGIEFGAVVRSEDGGRSWSGHRQGALRDCHSLAFHANRGEYAFEAGWGGAAVTQDAGRTWMRARAGLDRTYGWAVAADAGRPEVWYLSASPSPLKAHAPGRAQAHIFRSVAGAPWVKLTGGLPQPLDDMPYALVSNPKASGHICAGLGNGAVWGSADFGENWEQLPVSLGRIERSMIILW